jgi:Tfp pilus assembly pilus retraction ATPase PilT
LPPAEDEETMSHLADSDPDLNGTSYLLQQISRREGRYRFSDEDIKEIEKGIMTMTLTTKDLAVVSREHILLRSLNFPTRWFRHDDIPVAERKTFEWIVQAVDSTEVDMEPKQPLLVNWLVEGNGIFWVSGKAGSGKSTLMKFISSHKNTHLLLEK